MITAAATPGSGPNVLAYSIVDGQLDPTRMDAILHRATPGGFGGVAVLVGDHARQFSPRHGLSLTRGREALLLTNTRLAAGGFARLVSSGWGGSRRSRAPI